MEYMEGLQLGGGLGGSCIPALGGVIVWCYTLGFFLVRAVVLSVFSGSSTICCGSAGPLFVAAGFLVYGELFW